MMHTGYSYRDLREEIRLLQKERNIRRHLATRSAPAIVRMRRTVLEELEIVQARAHFRGVIDWQAVILTVFAAAATAALGRGTYDLMCYVNTGVGGWAFVSTLSVGFLALLSAVFTSVITSQIPHNLRWRVTAWIRVRQLNKLYKLLEAQRIAYLDKARAEGNTRRIEELELD